MEIIAYMFGILGLVAFVRVEHLIRTLKTKGVLETSYNDE
jgi:hypothetical protein